MYGKKLKSIRKHMELTQEKMAELLKISNRTYVSYERDENNPPYSMLVNLCRDYNVNLNWFIADIGKMFILPEYSTVKDEILKEVEKMLKDRGIN